MLTGNWLEIGKLNQITVTIDGKKVLLRCTVSQVERFQALGDTAQDAPAGDRVLARRLMANAVDVAEIALNPLPTESQFTRNDIETKLDVDQIALIAKTWVDRKIYAPRVEADPILGPQEKGR